MALLKASLHLIKYRLLTYISVLSYLNESNVSILFIKYSMKVFYAWTLSALLCITLKQFFSIFQQEPQFDIQFGQPYYVSHLVNLTLYDTGSAHFKPVRKLRNIFINCITVHRPALAQQGVLKSIRSVTSYLAICQTLVRFIRHYGWSVNKQWIFTIFW